MKTSVDEIAPEIFRIATFDAEDPLTLVQFLIRDEMPLLFHTGPKGLFQVTYEAVSRLIDPRSLRYISWSHLESDECGALNQFLVAAPGAEAVHGTVSGMLGASDFFNKPITVLPDDQVLDLGAKKLRFLSTPHVPHCWDAIVAYEETTGVLFVSDLFSAFGDVPALTESDIVGPALSALLEFPDYLPIGPHIGPIFDRMAALEPKVIAGHHSSTSTGNAVQSLQDLRGELLRRAGLKG